MDCSYVWTLWTMLPWKGGTCVKISEKWISRSRIFRSKNMSIFKSEHVSHFNCLQNGFVQELPYQQVHTVCSNHVAQSSECMELARVSDATLCRFSETLGWEPLCNLPSPRELTRYTATSVNIVTCDASPCVQGRAHRGQAAGWHTHPELILSEALNAWLSGHALGRAGPGNTDFTKENLSRFQREWVLRFL